MHEVCCKWGARPLFAGTANPFALALVFLLAVGQGRGVEPEDLRPGLIATFRDNVKPQPLEVVRLEPTIALLLRAGEAPHPRLRADGGTAVWKGQLNVGRAVKYRFAVQLRGRFRLRVAGKEVLQADSAAASPVRKEGAEIELPAGVQPLVAEFTRLPGTARVELLWQGPGFREEPLPFFVAGHLAAEVPPRLAADTLVEQGRFLAEERNCVKCHQADEGNNIAAGLAARPGPDLSEIGQRAFAGWIYRWLEAPRRLRPAALMPEMFSPDEAGRVERFAVTRFLVSLGGPLQPNPKPPPPGARLASSLRGFTLLTSTGCVACHDKDRQPLSGLGGKTTPERLARYLANPLALDPGGRMPNMLLTGREAEDLAHYLCLSPDTSPKRQRGDRPRAGAWGLWPPDGGERDLPAAPAREKRLAAFQRVEKRADELAQFERLDAAAQWLDLGQRVVIDRGCNNCHTIAPGGKPFASVQAGADLADLRQKERQHRGCLAEEPDRRGVAPWFGLSARERAALRAFLGEGLDGAGSPAPGYAARVDLQRYHCLACHSREGEGGLRPEQVKQLRLFEMPENAEEVSPPTLTGVGHKLRTPWLRQVLTQAGRARPWRLLRMPQFGADLVGKLPEGLAALEGIGPDDTVHKIALTPAQREAGRSLAGKKGFGCVSCHDLAGNPTSGTRGTDLATSHQRVRYEWYLRWLEQPQRLDPGTRMPVVFPGGKTLLELLGGNPRAQAEAMWGYLALPPHSPPPSDGS